MEGPVGLGTEPHEVWPGRVDAGTQTDHAPNVSCYLDNFTDFDKAAKIYVDLITHHSSKLFKLHRILESDAQLLLEYNVVDGTQDCERALRLLPSQDASIRHSIFRAVDRQPEVVLTTGHKLLCSDAGTKLSTNYEIGAQNAHHREDIGDSEESEQSEAEEDSQNFIRKKIDDRGADKHLKESMHDLLDAPQMQTRSKTASNREETSKHPKSFLSDFDKMQAYQLILKEKTYRCKDCFKSFFSEAGLNYHQTTPNCCSQSAKPTCSGCGQQYDSIKQLLKHKRSCEFSRAMFSGVKVKKKTYQDKLIKTHRCPVCSERFRTLINLYRHKKKHRGNKRGYSQAHICPTCGRTFVTYNALKAHLVARHSNKPQSIISSGASSTASNKQGTLSCNICAQHFKDPRALKVHRIVQHKQKKTNEPTDFSKLGLISTMKGDDFISLKGPKFPCTSCGKTFQDERLMQIHHMTHSGINHERCSICSDASNKAMFSKDPKQKSSWTQIHKQMKWIKCPHCDKRCNSRGDLTRHIRSHTGEKPYMCTICGKCFASNMGRKAHEETHDGQRPYSCPVCNKTFTRRSTLMSHKQIHIREGKPYLCPTCGNSFATAKSLHVHSKLHSTERPYVCNICNKAYTRKDTLRYHMQGHMKNINNSQIQQQQQQQQPPQAPLHPMAHHQHHPALPEGLPAMDASMHHHHRMHLPMQSQIDMYSQNPEEQSIEQFLFHSMT